MQAKKNPVFEQGIKKQSRNKKERKVRRDNCLDDYLFQT